MFRELEGDWIASEVDRSLAIKVERGGLDTPSLPWTRDDFLTVEMTINMFPGIFFGFDIYAI